MASATCPGGLWFGIEVGKDGGTTLVACRMNGAGERVAYVFYCAKAGTLDAGEFCIYGAPANAQDLKVSWQDLDANDVPDGTADQWVVVPAASVTSNAWIAPGVMTDDGTPTGVKRVVTLGQRVALVIEWNGTAGDIQLRSIDGPKIMANLSCIRSGGVWTRYPDRYPDMTVKYSDATYVAPYNCWPICQGAASGPAVSTATTPDEVGLSFTVPMPCTLAGITWGGQVSAGGTSDYDVVLYNSASAVLATTSVDASLTAKWNIGCELYVPLGDVALQANVTYRVAIKPTTATALPHVGYFVQNTAAIAQYVVGGGWAWTERTDGGAWSTKSGSDSTLQCHTHIVLHLAAAEASGTDATPLGIVSLGGVIISGSVIKNSVRITETADEAPNTATLIVRGSTSLIPLAGQEIIIGLGDLTHRLFAGNVLHVEQLRPKLNQRFPRYRLDCVDYTWQFDWTRVEAKAYVGVDASVVIADLVASFAPSFSTARVPGGLGLITGTSNFEELLSAAVARCIKSLGGFFRVDYDKVVHAFVSYESDNNPADLDSSNSDYWGFVVDPDISQVRTLVKVLGGSTTTTAAAAIAATSVAVNDTVKFAAAGGLALAGANKISYTGKSAVSGPANLTGIPAAGALSITVRIEQGETVRVGQYAQDATAAAALRAKVDPGHLITGWTGYVEHVVESGDADDARCLEIAQADLLLYKDEDLRIRFSTRDRFAIAGKSIVVNLTNPATGQVVSGTFLLQQVVVRGIEMAGATLWPIRDVDAGLNRRDLMDLLAKLTG